MFANIRNTGIRNDEKAIVNALNASLAVIEFTPSGQILHANKNFTSAVGYELNEIVGRHHSLFCDPEYAASAEYRAFWDRLASGQFQANEYKRVAKGGRIVWLQATYNPVRSKAGVITKVIKFAADITAQKLQSIDHAGKVTAISRAQAVIEFTPAGEVISANANFLSALGYSLDDIKGRHHSLFCDGPYAQSPEYRSFWSDLASGQLCTGEFKRIGKNGRVVYIQASYNPIFDDTGAVVKVVKFATDMTDIVNRRLRNDELSQDINRELGAVLAQVGTANEMTTGASGASTETGAIIHSVAAAAEELSLSVREISQSMAFAKAGVENVFRYAKGANVSADGLNASASSMNSVVTLIQDIAGQINLLALNATIESARAGEAGRGFAVVASEVKSLANQAGQSTKTIASEIANMQAATAEVVEALSSISEAITAVLENVASVASAMEQQNAVTGEISLNMQTAVTAVNEIEGSLGHISSAFLRVVGASEQVKRNVETLVA